MSEEPPDAPDAADVAPPPPPDAQDDDSTDAMASAGEGVDADDEPRANFFIVGIGASAGGFEAISALVRRLGPPPSIALVVVQHLLPGHPSMLTELLGRLTQAEVLTVTDGVKVEPGGIVVVALGAAVVVRVAPAGTVPVAVWAVEVEARWVTDGEPLPVTTGEAGSRVVVVVVPPCDPDLHRVGAFFDVAEPPNVALTRGWGNPKHARR